MGGAEGDALSQGSFFQFRVISALENPPEHPLFLRNYVLFATRRVKTVPEYFIIPRQPRGRLLPLCSPFAFTLDLARLIRSARETVKLHYYTCLFAGQILISLIPKGGPKLRGMFFREAHERGNNAVPADRQAAASRGDGKKNKGKIDAQPVNHPPSAFPK